MTKKKIVVALGGNALGNNAEEQKKLVAQTAVPIVDLVEEGYDVVLAHGNGPQVGMINLSFQNAGTAMPFPECGAMSQGYIGYHLQNAIYNELHKRQIKKNVATIVTQVLVDEKDPAFQNPTKPIGTFYTEEQAKEIAKEHPDYVMKEDAGRGYRRVVPSPRPVDIVEKEMISELVDNKNLVIATGGGGIPVVQRGDRLEGVAAVIDKDFASARLAQLVGADTLIILTAVEKVAINFGKENEEWLGKITADEIQKHADNGMFAKGSMLPKVEAAMEFVRSGAGREALITSLEKAREGILGQTGTLIVQ